MYKENQPQLWVNVLFDDGGAGDCVARLPAVKYIYDNHPHVKVSLWVPDFFYDYAKNALRHTKSRILISKWSDGPKHFVSGFPAKSFRNSTVNNLGLHMTEHAFYTICGTTPTDKNAYNYLSLDLSDTDISRFNLPQNYVVVSTGFTAEVRQFLPQYINEITQYLLSRNVTPVFLGKRETPSGLSHVIEGNFNTEIDYTCGIDLIDKTTLFEATKVLANAKAVIGLDNGILHLAGATDVPIIGGYTTVNPEHRMPYRNGELGYKYHPVVPPTSLACRFCQSNWQFTFAHNFTSCYYKTTDCVKQLTSNLYIQELDKIL